MRAIHNPFRCMESAGFPRPAIGAIALWLAGMGAPAALCAQAEPAATQEYSLIEEVIVTAQKREQNLNDLGISVTAFSASDILELGLSQPLDLAAQTPNLNINNSIGNSIPNISIRGLGLNDYAVNNNPAAGVYVDELYLVSPAMLSFQLFDLERVEVLKGPQGTLYGRNTTAGAINFVSRKPGEQFQGRAAASYGNFDRRMAEVAAGGPLAPGLKGRLAVKGVWQNKGHQRNRHTGQDVGALDQLSWRLLLDMQPAGNLDALLNLHGGRDDSDVHLVKVDNIFTATDDAFFPGDPFSSAGRPDSFMNLDGKGGVLTLNWRASERTTLTFLTGYEDFSRLHAEDRDGTALVQLDGQFRNDIEQFSQEVRLSYAGDALVLIVGAFYGTDQVRTRDRFDTEQFFADGIFPFRTVGNEYVQETDSLAAFAHSEWLLGEDWRLTAGLRYTDERKDFGDAFTFIYVDAPPAQGGTELQVFPPVANEYEVGDLSGKLGIDYLGLEGALLYASLSKGFKSGNFQGQLTFLPATLENFDAENVLAYEAGFKRRLAGNRLQLNGAAFLYDYEDVQIYGPIYRQPIDPLFGIDNAGNARVLGLEIDLLWRAAAGLDVRLGLGLLDTEITKSVLSTIEEGSELPNSPKVNFNALLKYQREIGGGLSTKAVLDASYKGETTYDIVRQPESAVEEGYWLANARIGLTDAGERWEIYLWARNLLNEKYRSQVLNSTVGAGESWGLPRTYGIAIERNWQAAP